MILTAYSSDLYQLLREKPPIPIKKKKTHNGDGQSNTAGTSLLLGICRLGNKLMNFQFLGHKLEKRKNLPTKRPTTWFVRAKGVCSLIIYNWDPALSRLFRHCNISVDLFLLFNKRARGQSNDSITHTYMLEFRVKQCQERKGKIE